MNRVGSALLTVVGSLFLNGLWVIHFYFTYTHTGIGTGTLLFQPLLFLMGYALCLLFPQYTHRTFWIFPVGMTLYTHFISYPLGYILGSVLFGFLLAALIHLFSPTLGVREVYRFQLFGSIFGLLLPPLLMKALSPFTLAWGVSLLLLPFLLFPFPSPSKGTVRIDGVGGGIGFFLYTCQYVLFSFALSTFGYSLFHFSLFLSLWLASGFLAFSLPFYPKKGKILFLWLGFFLFMGLFSVYGRPGVERGIVLASLFYGSFLSNLLLRNRLEEKPAWGKAVLAGEVLGGAFFMVLFFLTWRVASHPWFWVFISVLVLWLTIILWTKTLSPGPLSLGVLLVLAGTGFYVGIPFFSSMMHMRWDLTPYGMVEVIRRGAGNYDIYDNGLIMYSSSTEDTHNQPFVDAFRGGLSTSQPSFFILGGLTGTLVERLSLTFPQATITYGELDRYFYTMPLAYFPFRRWPKNFTKVFQDGYSYLLQSPSHYDGIVMDLPPPLDFQLARFYTKEFFQTVKKHLKPKGLFSFPLPYAIYGKYTHEYHCIMNTFLHVFPQGTLYYTPAHEGYYFILFVSAPVTLSSPYLQVTPETGPCPPISLEHPLLF